MKQSRGVRNLQTPNTKTQNERRRIRIRIRSRSGPATVHKNYTVVVVGDGVTEILNDVAMLASLQMLKNESSQ